MPRGNILVGIDTKPLVKVVIKLTQEVFFSQPFPG
ncbi:Hypothetical protein Minf_0452 [Methylacidiphilum infernorum V4]|uniref:Uncharacterized protein n=1 Tax=Methylacidiphilum infernorum (isolate V4) TaxID=481448 RepID=B3DYY8_METI4|nr:Hypothetical protein Minf_0452 [Methylacidiphilum infernorum V4]